MGLRFYERYGAPLPLEQRGFSAGVYVYTCSICICRCTAAT